MFRTPKVIFAPVAEPVTLAEARAHLEAQAYEDSDVDPIDDAMIEAWITAAREYCEQFLGLALATQVLEIALDSFPTSTDLDGVAIDLPMGPVREIIQVMVPPPEIEYTSDDVDSDSAADEPIWADGEVNPDLYVLDNYRRPNQIKPVASWPVITAASNAVKIRYLAGYGVDSDGGEALPKAIRAALLLMLGHLYAHRESVSPDSLMAIPLGVESLLRPHRVRLGMA
jgi:uncharacterized phiE125 gp8 family phage protein